MEIANGVLETYARLTQELRTLERAVELRKRLRQWCHMNMYEMEWVGKEAEEQPAVAVRIRNAMYPEYAECIGDHMFPLHGFLVYEEQLQYLLACVRNRQAVDVPVAIYSHLHGEPLAERDTFDLGVVKVEEQHFLSVRMCGTGEELDFPIGEECVVTMLQKLLQEIGKVNGSS